MMFLRTKKRHVFIGFTILVGGCLLLYTIKTNYSPDFRVSPAQDTTITHTNKDTSIHHIETTSAVLKSQIEPINDFSSIESEYEKLVLNGYYAKQPHLNVPLNGVKRIFVDNSYDQGQPSEIIKEYAPLQLDNGEHISNGDKRISVDSAYDAGQPSVIDKEYAPLQLDNGEHISNGDKRISVDNSYEQEQASEINKEYAPLQLDNGEHRSNGDKRISVDSAYDQGQPSDINKEYAPLQLDNGEHQNTLEQAIAAEYKIPAIVDSRFRSNQNSDGMSAYWNPRPGNVTILTAHTTGNSASDADTTCPFPELKQFPEPLYNFNTFPCFSGITPSVQLEQNGKCVRTVNFPDTMLRNGSGCTMLRSGRGTPICTYPSQNDVHVSRMLNTEGYWEAGLVAAMLNILEGNPGMVLLDAGCNVGVYTLAAASMSHKVIAVDASYENLFLVSKSLTLGNLWEHVTLIWNAISRKHELVVLRKEVDPKNVGGAEIDPNNKTVVGCDISVNAIVLDDLKDLFVNKKVFIKIDIQGQEHNFFQHGKEFFKMADVRYVQMEYEMHRGTPSGRAIIDTMIGYGFLPYTDCLGHRILKPTEETHWPFDLCFIRVISLT